MDAELKRVKKNLRQHVVDFFAERMAGDRMFHGADLAQWCIDRAHCSPSSPDRIMRELARDGVLRYTLLSRSASQYRADFVAAEQLELFAA